MYYGILDIVAVAYDHAIGRLARWAHASGMCVSAPVRAGYIICVCPYMAKCGTDSLAQTQTSL